MEDHNDITQDTASQDQREHQPIRLVVIPAPSLDSVLVQSIIGALRYKRFLHKDDISFYTVPIYDTDMALVFSIRRRNLMTSMEEDLILENVAKTLNDSGYQFAASYDCGIKNGRRLLLEQIYKKA